MFPNSHNYYLAAYKMHLYPNQKLKTYMDMDI